MQAIDCKLCVIFVSLVSAANHKLYVLLVGMISSQEQADDVRWGWVRTRTRVQVWKLGDVLVACHVAGRAPIPHILIDIAWRLLTDGTDHTHSV